MINKPALYCIINPDGQPHMDELCVATEPGVLEDEIAVLNDLIDDGDPLYTVQPLFFVGKSNQVLNENYPLQLPPPITEEEGYRLNTSWHAGAIFRDGANWMRDRIIKWQAGEQEDSC